MIMKKTFLISLLSIAGFCGYAQTEGVQVNVDRAGCLRDADMPANAVPAWPKSAYTPAPAQDASCAPCYEYKNKRGTAIMECPFLVFPSQAGEDLPGTSAVTVTGNDISLETPNTYTGNYPACSKKMYPAHTEPVWPKSAYTPTGNPNCAPCYEYTNKRGTVIMECPYLTFPSEREKAEKGQ